MHRYSYCMTNLQKGLVGHWTMDSRDVDNGVLRDRSAYDNDGTISGASANYQSPIGEGFSFNGQDDYISLPNLSAFNQTPLIFTVSAWFKTTSGGNILHPRGQKDIDFEIVNNNVSMGWYDGSNPSSVIGSTAVSDGEYHHAVWQANVSSGNQRLYVDGKLEVESSQTFDPNDISTTNTIARKVNTHYSGQISDLRIYDRVLSKGEVEYLYQQRNTRQTSSRGFPVAAENLVARYPFRDGSARDDARNENYGEPTGYDGTVDGATYDSKGGPKVDGSFNFDGDNDYIAIDGFTYQGPDVGDITVMSWFKTTASSQSIIASYDRSEYWRLEIGSNAASDGSVGMSFRTDSGTTDGFGSTTRVDDDNWHHVVFTYSSGSAKLYLDGTEQNSGSYGNYIGDDSTTRYGFIGVGSEANSFNGSVGPSDYFDGVIDDFRIYNAQLTDTDVKQIYQNTRPQISASGGTTVTTERINGEQYRIHAFEDVGTSTFEVSDAQANATADVLVVGGGGGAGIGINSSDEGTGGGGAGEVINDSVNISPQSYTITVADGGNSGTTDNIDGNDGGNSQAFGFTATGGFGSARTEGYSTAGGDYGGDGNPGGESNLGDTTSDAADDAGGGGGGASEPGQQAPSEYEAGDGGDGLDVSNIFGTQFGENGVFGGGGGGGVGASEDGTDVELGVGGNGGGGNGGESSNISAEDGIDNTGGGAGGASQTGERAGNGGSGIVLIRYKL